MAFVRICYVTFFETKKKTYQSTLSFCLCSVTLLYFQQFFYLFLSLSLSLYRSF